jgi:anaerobic ribonucleoside-triphosphate reductase activating protein
MNIADIKYYDTLNGIGIRTSVFVSGCRHACKGCFNAVAWNFNYGSVYTDQTILTILNSFEAARAQGVELTGISFLGGEPFDPENVGELSYLAALFKKHYPDKTLWIWTGYVIEELAEREDTYTDILLSLADIIIDGKFIEDKKDLTKKFRGSTNQRIIDCSKSRQTGQFVFLTDDEI